MAHSVCKKTKICLKVSQSSSEWRAAFQLKMLKIRQTATQCNSNRQTYFCSYTLCSNLIVLSVGWLLNVRRIFTVLHRHPVSAATQLLSACHTTDMLTVGDFTF